jgi:hypothetical protein
MDLFLYTRLMFALAAEAISAYRSYIVGAVANRLSDLAGNRGQLPLSADS